MGTSLGSTAHKLQRPTVPATAQASKRTKCKAIENGYNMSLTNAVNAFQASLDPSCVEAVDELILNEAGFVERLFQVTKSG